MSPFFVKKTCFFLQEQFFFDKKMDSLTLGSCLLGWFKIPVSSRTNKLMAGTKFSDYLGLNHYIKAKKLKYFIHLRLAQRPQSLSTWGFSFGS